ncbi:MAG: RluA family pseudouridine synthase [Blautia sp.]|nr:RluA family pseudouridine synthase [Eubacteriales bacterium]MED9965803.1 RluA family pseudouridine synthase [Blautia sp.]
MAKKIFTLSIGEELEDISVEQLLKREFHLSKREISRAKFQENGICLNGEKVRVNQKVRKGDCLTVSFEEEKTSNILLPSEGSLCVLYEDDDLLIVNKPPMIPTQPTGRHAARSLCNLVYAYALEREKTPLIRPVGRLDMETSGVVVFAKNQIAASRLSAQRENGTFEKIYYAFVAGKMENKRGIICEPIGAVGCGKGRERIKMQVCAEGKPAVTLYEAVKNYENMALVRLRLKTGRTHQIRVHMNWLGHTLLGDQLYEEKERVSPLFSRAALHAGEVKLQHPFTGESICVSAPFPEDFCKADRELLGAEGIYGFSAVPEEKRQTYKV